MRTRQIYDVSSALFGRTRRAVLGLLFTHPDEALHLRELARRAGAGLGGVDREVNRLASAGIINRKVQGRQVYYQSNTSCPVFAELKSLMVKTSGVADVLRNALAPLSARIHVAFIHGSFARAQQDRGSDVDVVIVGDISLAEAVAALSNAQDSLGREINPAVYPPAEFRVKLGAKNHFLRTLLKAEKVFLIGDQRELRNLAP